MDKNQNLEVANSISIDSNQDENLTNQKTFKWSSSKGNQKQFRNGRNDGIFYFALVDNICFNYVLEQTNLYATQVVTQNKGTSQQSRLYETYRHQ